jgi:hypothetical protein
MPPQILFTVIVFNSLVLFVPVAALLLLRWPRLWHILFALFLGALAGWTDLRTDEVQLPALLLITFSFFLGFAQPRHAWRWGLILGLWVPIMEYAALAAGLRATPASDVLGSFLALVFALVGAYAGVFCNWASARLQAPGVRTA